METVFDSDSHHSLPVDYRVVFQVTEETVSASSKSTDDVTSGDTVSLPQLYFVMCFLSVLAVVGSGGNAIVLYVFGAKRDKLTSTVFIIALAAVDLVTCLIVIPFTVFMESVDFKINVDACCKLYHFLITSNVPCSALIMVAIAVDRYLCICHPFMRVMTVHRAKVSLYN